jgi:hypothetical protein
MAQTQSNQEYPCYRNNNYGRKRNKARIIKKKKNPTEHLPDVLQGENLEVSISMNPFDISIGTHSEAINMAIHLSIHIVLQEK